MPGKILTYGLKHVSQLGNTALRTLKPLGLIRYSIVEITPEENKKIQDDCAVTNTFYVRIKSSDFQYDISNTPEGRGDRIILLLKNFMPNQAAINNYFAAKKKCIALTGDNSSAEYCKCYKDLSTAATEFTSVYTQLDAIMKEGEVKFITQAVADEMQNYVNFLAGDYVQDLKAIENTLLKLNCK